MSTDCLANMCLTGKVDIVNGWTISGVMHAIQFVYYLPSNLIVHFISSYPSIYVFFEMDNQTGTGFGGFLLSTWLWWCLGLILGIFKDQ